MKWLVTFALTSTLSLASAQIEMAFFLFDAVTGCQHGNAELQVNQMGRDLQLTYSGRAGWNVSERLDVGFGIDYSNHIFEKSFFQDYFSLVTVNSFWFFEPEFEFQERVSFSFPIKLGVGGAVLRSSRNIQAREYANYFSFQPGGQVNLYPADWLRIYGGAGYRLNYGAGFTNFSMRNLSNAYFSLGIGIGRF